MGMQALYMMVDEQTLKGLLELEGEDLSEAIFELEEEERFGSADIDKSWDGLHFILTGTSASTPIEGNKLSEAVVGKQLLSYDEDADFIAGTERDELPEIIAALEAVDMDVLKQKFNPQALTDADIYPNIWTRDETAEELFDYLKSGYDIILAFYKEALAKNMHVVVSIL